MLSQETRMVFPLFSPFFMHMTKKGKVKKQQEDGSL